MDDQAENEEALTLVASRLTGNHASPSDARAYTRCRIRSDATIDLWTSG